MTATATDPALVCPEPADCPVVDTLPTWKVVDHHFDTHPWYRAYDGAYGFGSFNPGAKGDARFSPFRADDGGHLVPNLYLAETETAALLEALFRPADDIENHIPAHKRQAMSENKLREWLVVSMTTSRTAKLADFRNDALTAYGLTRKQIASASPEHYPCTRRLAVKIHADARAVEGILWHSRQTEATGHGDVEVAVLFGDRFPQDHRLWKREDAGSRNLYEGPGRELAEDVAEAVGITIIPDLTT